MENIPPLYIHERFEVSATRLFQLEKDSKELQRAKILIKRLRAENKVLKENEREWKLEQKSICRNFYRSIYVSGNAAKKWAISTLAKRLGIDFKYEGGKP